MTEEYKKYTERRAPKSPVLWNTLRAFLCGGALCAAAEGVRRAYLSFGLPEEDAALLNSSTLIFIAVLLTGLGVFDEIARFAGAGVLVPITGFANAVASPAIDSKTEGYVLGVGAKIFSVAGPVILYGVTSGVVYGALLMLWNALF